MLSIIFLRDAGDKDLITILINNIFFCIVVLIGIIGFVMMTTSTQGIYYASEGFHNYTNSPDYLEIEQSCDLDKHNNVSKSVTCLDQSVTNLSYTTIIMVFSILFTLGAVAGSFAFVLLIG